MGKKKKEQEIKYLDNELEAIKQVKEFKEICESNVVAMFWKNPDFYFEYDNINLESFVHNEWRVYWQIAYDILVKEHKKKLDENTVDIYLEKHKKLQEKYIGYGSFNNISNHMDAVNTENITGYVGELEKWNVVLQMIRARFPVSHRLKDFVDMNVEEIYDENEAMLNHIFMNVGGNGIRTYDLVEGLEDLIEELNEGLAVGLPLPNMDIFNKETNGFSLGEMYLLLAPSGAGKTSYVRSLLLPSILDHDEKIVFMINEEDIKKQQKEMLVWVINNVLKESIQKYQVNAGNFSDENKKLLNEAAKWLKEHKKQIIIVALDSFTTNKAIKIIKKYSALGVKYFVLDTFKHDADVGSTDAAWLDLQLNSVKLYDTIKPSAKNVCLICTMQLTKQSTKQRYYTMDNISSAKNVVDVTTGCYMFRWLLPDEYPDEKNELSIYKIVGKTKVPLRIKSTKRYQIMFLIKNRFGSTNEFCIVNEVDLSRNTYKEIGLCVVNPDF